MIDYNLKNWQGFGCSVDPCPKVGSFFSKAAPKIAPSGIPLTRCTIRTGPRTWNLLSRELDGGLKPGSMSCRHCAVGCLCCLTSYPTSNLKLRPTVATSSVFFFLVFSLNPRARKTTYVRRDAPFCSPQRAERNTLYLPLVHCKAD